MVNPDLDGLEGKWDKDESISRDEQLKIPTDSRLYALQVRVETRAFSYRGTFFFFLYLLVLFNNCFILFFIAVTHTVQ